MGKTHFHTNHIKFNTSQKFSRKGTSHHTTVFLSPTKTKQTRWNKNKQLHSIFFKTTHKHPLLPKKTHTKKNGKKTTTTTSFTIFSCSPNSSSFWRQGTCEKRLRGTKNIGQQLQGSTSPYLGDWSVFSPFFTRHESPRFWRCFGWWL